MKVRRRFKPQAWLAGVILLTALGLLQPALAAESPVLSDLAVSPATIDPAAGEVTQITFASNRPGQAIVRLYGPDWQQVRELVVENIEAERPVRLAWDGRDDQGAVVPSEAYFPVVEFADYQGGFVTLDPTFETRLGPVRLEDLHFDRQAGIIEYTLAAPARVTLHAGISDGGPLLRTLIADRPRPAGRHREPWNGMDEAGVVDIAAQKNFYLFADGISLWQPAIMVTGGELEYATYRRRAGQRPVKEGPQLSRVGGTTQALPRPHDITPEPRFRLSVAGSVSDGLPVVSGQVRLQVALDEDIRLPVIERRFEIVLFSELTFVTEVEEGHSPATIIWDSTTVPDGERLLTVNVATLPGQMSSASLRVRVNNSP